MTSDHNDYPRYIQALKQSAFLKDSTAEALDRLLSQMTAEQWRAKTFRNSMDVATTFHFIVSGRLKVYKSIPDTGREHTVFVLSKGDVFDVLSLLDIERNDAYWEALDTQRRAVA